jgi:Zn-dependent oligopeptidase
VIDKNRMKKTEMNQSASDNVFIQEFDQIFGSAGYIRYYFILEIP